MTASHLQSAAAPHRLATALRLAGALIVAVFIASCGGGDSVSPPPAATKLVFTSGPASIEAGALLAPITVAALDAKDNPVGGFTGAVTLGIAPGSGTPGAALTGTTTVNAVAGVATFSNVSITKSGTGYGLVASASGLTSAPATNGFDVSPAAASKLGIALQPSTSVANGGTLAQQPVVELRDAFDNLVATSGVVVTASIATGGGTLGGTTTATTVAGVATFTDLSLTGTVGNRTLEFSAPAVTSATSNAISLGAGTATHLALVTAPSATAANGAPFSQQPVVELRDDSENLVPTSGTVISVAIASGGGTLSGTVDVPTAGGVASFTDLALSGTVGDRTLAFSSGALTGVTSGTITLGVGAATALVITTEPSASAANATAFGQQPVVELRDASGNLRPDNGVVITAAIASGGGTLNGTVTATTVAGVASFTNLGITGTIGARTLNFTSGALTGATSASINLTAGNATHLGIATQPSAVAASGAAFGTQPAIQLLDVSDNPVPSSGVSVTAALASGGGTLGGTTTASTNAGGLATFTNLSISGSVGIRTLSFSATGLTGATSADINISAGNATRLAITIQPSSSTPSGQAFGQQPAIQLLDASDNVVAQAGVVITAAIQTGGGTLGGTATATTNGAGLATFTDLAITGLVGDRTLRFTSGVLTGVTSGSVTVTPGAASALTMATQPSATAQNGSAFAQQPAIQVRDGGGNPVSQAGLVITAAIASGGGTLNGTTTATTNASGVATFTNLGITGAAGARTLGFTSGALTSATSTSINITAGAATQLAIATQPSANAASGAAFAQQPAIQLQDASGNPVSQAGTVITAAIASGGGTLGGTATATTNAGGLATFTNLSITGTVGARTLSFTSGALTAATSTAINITVGTATQLAIATQPSASAASGAAFAQQPAIQLQDAGGNPVSQAGTVITASILTGGGTLGGTATATTNASGLATFTNLSITGLIGGRTLSFTSGALTSATSATINITVGAATQLAITTQPSASAASGAAFAQQPAIQLQDAGGNPVSQAGTVITASILTGGGTLGGTATATTNASGLATFTNLSITGLIGGRTLSFTSGALTAATSSTITLTAGAASTLVITTQPSASAASGAAFAQQPAIQLQDAGGNPVSQAGTVITAAIASGGGTLGGTATATTNAGGLATFTNLSITGTVGARTLSFSSGALTAATSTAINITAGTAAQLVIATQPSASAASGAAFAQQPAIQLQDAGGNPVSQAGTVITASILTGGGTLGGTATATTNASGLATFTNLSITGLIGGRTLSFTSGALTSATSATINITVGAATQLAITTQPSATATNTVAFGTQPVIQIRDGAGNDVAQNNTTITAAIATGGGTLGGTLTATTNASGQATFTGLAITGTLGNRTLQFTATGLTTATSNTVNVNAAGPATQLAVTTQPSATVANTVVFPAQPAVQLRDVSGNNVTQAGTAVTVAITAAQTGTLRGTLTVNTAATGIATFAGLSILAPTVGNRTLTFSSGALTAATSGNINITVGQARIMSISAGNAQTATVGTAVAIDPAVLVTDSGGIAVAGRNVTFTVTAGGGTSQAPTTVATNASGIATATGWTLGATAGTNNNSLQATSTTPAPALTAVTFTASATAQVSGTMWISNFNGANIGIFPASATGNVAPTNTLSSTAGGLANPAFVARDASNLYVSDYFNGQVLVFTVNATGDVAPVRSITGLINPTGLAVNGTSLYVADQGNATVYVFPVAASGALGVGAIPTRTITGANTVMQNPSGLALDGDTLYVADNGGFVSTFSPTANGDVAPVRTLNTPDLATPWGIALDATGGLWIANLAGGTGGTGSVVRYARGSSGTDPIATNTLDGVATLLNQPVGLAINGNNVFVVNFASGAEAVLSWPTTATGNVAPSTNLTGANAGFSSAFGISF